MIIDYSFTKSDMFKNKSCDSFKWSYFGLIFFNMNNKIEGVSSI